MGSQPRGQAQWTLAVRESGARYESSKIRKGQHSKRTSMHCDVREQRGQEELHHHLQHYSKILIEIGT